MESLAAEERPGLESLPAVIDAWGPARREGLTVAHAPTPRLPSRGTHVSASLGLRPGVLLPERLLHSVPSNAKREFLIEQVFDQTTERGPLLCPPVLHQGASLSQNLESSKSDELWPALPATALALSYNHQRSWHGGRHGSAQSEPAAAAAAAARTL